MPTLRKTTDGAAADSEDWGERAADSDAWGTTGAAALAARKKAARVADGEGRLMSVAEAREMLQQLDVATARAQGWLRGKDAKTRLAAMGSLAGAYPKLQEGRAEARNPLQMLQDAFWQRPPVHQVRRCPLPVACF